MTLAATAYNERSWAIDLIGHLKHLANKNNRSVKDVGGEQTVKVEGGSLFPDVLLFGDRSTARILQGWELKMPDTSIDDYEFRNNAEYKAKSLGLDSFLLWNVSQARLYIKDVGGNFILRKEWNYLVDITTRTGVMPNRQRWEKLAEEILGYLNDLFDRGTLEGRQFIEAYRSGGVTALIMENADAVATALNDAACRDATLRAEIALWWDRCQAEYGSKTKESALAQAIISNWVGKILFAHILREKDQRAHAIASLTNETTPHQALELFKKLSEECNFWTIFSDSIGLSTIPKQPWSQLKQFNSLLTDLRVGSVDQAQLSGILEATVEVAVRKLRGQYPTPIELARLLVCLCVRNTVDDRVLDPCCGSGTIARAALEQKLLAKVPVEQAAATVFAGDQDPQAIQISTFALARPDLMHMPMRLFQRDAFTLTPEMLVDFRHPTTGVPFTEKVGRFDAIVSNLPFVSQNGRRSYEDAIQRVIKLLDENGNGFSKRADISAYLPFSFYPLLKDGGRLGIIITNAWLGTDWGDDFYNSLGKYYDLKSVITSGAGRWFQNSEVITNILIMEKKNNPDQASSDVQFVVLKHPIEELANDETVQIAAAQIELGLTQNETMTIRTISTEKMAEFRKIGLGGNAQFVDCDWLLDLPLVPLRSIFSIQRGERRGKNELFYPEGEHGIEAEYIHPLAKSPQEFSRPIASATKKAFSCSRTMDELRDLGHTGALQWIKRFETPENIKKLGKKGIHWYEMKADRQTDLVMFVNYGYRLFVGRVNPPAFVDQRMMCLDPLDGVDIELSHALLNSTISMFIIEGFGFGRGQGALDLNKTRIENYMHTLDPSALNQESADDIKAKFTPLLKRDILDVADELDKDDRKALDDAIIKAFNLNVSRDHIYESLKALVEIRRTAKDG